ncbi:MAG TPA: TAXI family TRAP transporter solute-binding subunit [Chloroflexota bacterium]|nr:TAXI family TRAP transporter solute-binding subunit [Chloroflexota bacterium]
MEYESPVPASTRSLVMLEVAAELVAPRESPYPQAQVQLRPQGAEGWTYTLIGSDTPEAIWQVARREVDIATINPSGPLTMAFRGKGPFREPVPVRAIAVIPSLDWLGFAVKTSTGLTSLADVKGRKYPLRVSIRAQKGHSTILYIDSVLAAYGFSLDDIERWGGHVSYDAGMPYAPARSRKVASGEVEAVFDEALTRFIPMMPDLGLRLLPIHEPVLRAMEELGLRRGTITQKLFPTLDRDVVTLDFSGWPVFTHADVDAEFVYAFCRALAARRGDIPFQEPGPLPLETMCCDSEAGPLDVPLHPGAERYWREVGYLR